MFQTTAFSGHKVTSVKQFQVEDYEALLKKRHSALRSTTRKR